MIFKMYSIKDKLNGYTTPIPMVDDKVGMRYFKDQIIGNPTMKNTPEDFEFYHMGTFDTESGTFMAPAKDGKPELVAKGVDYAES